MPPEEPATPSPATTVTPGPDGWLGPTQISMRHYVDPSLVVDSDGSVHVGAQLGNDVYYVTNSSGSWTREQISSAPRAGSHTVPSITRGADGSLWIAFADRCPDCAPNFSAGVHLASMQAGGWSAPVSIPDHVGERPYLVVDDGVVHIGDTDINSSGPVDNLDDIFRPVYVTNESGTWRLTEVARQGTTLAFQRADDGELSVIYVARGGRRSVGDNLHLAVAASGADSFASIPIVDDGTTCNQAAAFGVNGDAAVFRESSVPGGSDFACAEVSSPQYMRLSDGSWSEPIEAPLMPRTVILDAGGAVHALAVVHPDFESTELWYVTDAGGSFTTHLLTYYPTSDIDVGHAIALDTDGRSHIFFSSELGTFYAVAPAH